MHTPPRIVLTGATGFLGSHIAAVLRQHNHPVTALVRTSSRTQFLEQLDVDCRRVDFEQPTSLLEALRGADILIHSAATVHLQQRWRDFLQATVTSTRHVLNAAAQAGIRRFLHISTVGVYGWPRSDGRPFTEADPRVRPFRWNYYTRAKTEAEKLVQAATGMETTILRPSWIYGPRDSTSFARIVDALRRQRYRWIGDGTNRLSLIFVTDVAEAVYLAATHPAAAGQIYNISADELAGTQREFITQITHELGLPLPSGKMSYRAAHRLGFLGESIAHCSGYRIQPPITRLSVLLLGGQRRYSNSKLKAELGWKPLIALKDGVRATAEWYRTA